MSSDGCSSRRARWSRSRSRRLTLWLPVLAALSSTPALAGKEACLECHSSGTYALPALTKHRVVPCDGCHAGYLDVCRKGNLPPLEPGSLTASIAARAPRSPSAAAACVGCHQEAYAQWAESDHGRAVLHASGSDAPFCFDCHGSAHELGGASGDGSVARAERANAACARCHEDPALAERNGMNPHIVQTYRDSLHAKALALGDEHSAACHDCHNAHDIRGSEDAQSVTAPGNVREMCGRCHAGATDAFAASFGHHAYTKTDLAIGYWITQFFTWMTFFVMGFLLIHAALDAAHALRNKKTHA